MERRDICEFGWLLVARYTKAVLSLTSIRLTVMTLVYIYVFREGDMKSLSALRQ